MHIVATSITILLLLPAISIDGDLGTATLRITEVSSAYMCEPCSKLAAKCGLLHGITDRE